jgi:predicted small metal-binding protein
MEMAKEISCVVAGCGWHGSAPTEGELLEKVVAHAAHGHDIKEVSPELAARVKAAIQDR